MPASTVARQVLELLPPQVGLPHSDQVLAYFDEFPTLASLVPIVCRLAAKAFPDDKALSLEVYHDPEVEDHYLMLRLELFGGYSQTREIIDGIWEQVEQEAGVDLCDVPGWMSIIPIYRKRANAV